MSRHDTSRSANYRSHEPERDRDHDRYRDRASTYRPSPPYRARTPPSSSDRWRPNDASRDRWARREADSSHRVPHEFKESDVYRPRVPQSDFTFRLTPPAGVNPVNFNAASGLRTNPSSDREHCGHPKRLGRNRRQPPPHPSERALITGATYRVPQQRLHDTEGGAKFRDLDELSDDEVAMDMSSASEPKSETSPGKRARTDRDLPGAEAVPKWSNPDPYTTLPCPDESSRRQRDMVKLIRRARMDSDKSHALKASTAAEDFISFNMTSDSEDANSDASSGSRPRSHQRARAEDSGVKKPDPSYATDSRGVNGRAPDGPASFGGARKRTADDEIKPPNYRQSKKMLLKPSNGSIVTIWQPKKHEDPCPWTFMDHSAECSMSIRLHKEVVDFYDFVRPRPFEQRIRDLLVGNLRIAMRREGRNFASAQVHPFGSFMSGLYLPTADMDLVVCSASFMRGGPPTYLGAKSWLYKFQRFLIAQDVAQPDSVEVIAQARIPLVKYIDKSTGLKVDVSFENMGGVRAIETFLKWQRQYPAMPMLVTLVKHFLLMRGLNEPVNGGIGGFSVICLVVSMLQLMPQVQSRNLVAEHHLGELLLNFFDLYGRQFRYDINAISLTRPVGYLRKSDVTTLRYRSMDRLSIIDPNNPANDISGGSSNTKAIMAKFHEAFNLLRSRMGEVAQESNGGGILDVILKGDYSTFRIQRGYLKHIHEELVGPC